MSALKFLQSDAFDSADTHIRHKPFSFMTSAGLLDDAARATRGGLSTLSRGGLFPA